MTRQSGTSQSVFMKPAASALLALLTCALWGSAFPAIKRGFLLLEICDTGSKILFAGYRFFLAGVFTLGFSSIRARKFLTIKRSVVPYIMLQGVLQTTIQYLCFYIGLSNTTGTRGAVINGANGFFSMIAAHFITKDEKLNKRKLIGCAVGFIGIIIVNLGGEFGGTVSFRGEGMVLLCTIAYGVSSVTLKLISHMEVPNVITAYQLLFGGIFLIIIGVGTGGRVTGLTLSSSALLVYLSLASTISFCLWANLLKYNPVGKIAIYGFTVPVFGVMMSAVFLGEKGITPVTFLALCFVSAGVIIVNREKKAE